MLQRSIEALDYKDLEVSSITLEDTTPSSKRFAKLPSIDNNSNASPSSLANILADPEFARFLQEASTQFDQIVLDLLDTIFQ